MTTKLDYGAMTTTVTHNGKTYEAEYGTVEKTHLGYEDHGIMTLWLHMNFYGTGQGAGGYSLDTPLRDENDNFIKRVGSAYGMNFIMEVLRVAGVSKWEDVVGVRLLVLRETPYGKIDGIANAESREVLIFDEVYREWGEV